jgi:hypothetical protein
MTQFNHVKVVNIYTEREHHTKHGLHLNKQRKHWIANNLVKEMRNLYLPPKKNSTYNTAMENATQQVNPVNPVMSSRMCDEPEPLSPGDVQDRSWNTEIDDAQDVEPKNHPTLTSEQTQTAPPKQVKVA